MGEHESWFHYLPGYYNLQSYAAHYLQRKTMFVGFERTHFSIAHVLVSLFVVVLLIVAALRYAGRLHAAGDTRFVPDRRFGVRTVFDLIIDATLSMAEGVMGRKDAERFLPLFGTLALFILFNNLIGLVPGFLPPTDTLKTNFALSGFVLFVTTMMGFREQGLGYLKHFAGPIWWLSPLILIIEVVSQLLVRPASLAVRLMGNMFADHKLLGVMTMLVPLLVPLPFYVLGILVCVVQTLVFSLLSMIYIGEAVSHEQAH